MIEKKPLAVVFSLAVTLALFWPVRENWQEKPKDEFPLSYYPMFSHKRKPTYSFTYFVGYDATGNRHTIPYKYLGTGGFNQVRRQVRKSAKTGKHDDLTMEVAKRLARSKREPLTQIVQVEMVKGRYHLEDYFLTKKKEPLKEKVYSRQNIERK
ncbi:hypothetical protein FNH22_11220 [Fulvivirga sp. M361]|uniref:hypothetical protein n=1 Tax=Fulvivirga sp. M361 TaxID=2594266 RepID=UPI00117A87B6|nr:hypothetical protein [Fulvivirga sp. M361]TRX59088.1 hypothetical protein FNH22_11220 [Fulvivirga sp. M361]